MPVGGIFVAAVPLAWLLPNHYWPWLSAWQDGLALAMITIAAISFRGTAMIARSWVLFSVLAVLNLAAQALGGHIFFSGDAWIAAFYVASFLVAVLVGQIGAAHHNGVPTAGLSAIALGVLVAAMASVGIALAQWTGTQAPGIWMVEIPRGGRPFGNVAQPNHLCTISFLGLTCSGLLRQQGRIGRIGFWPAALLMILGMVLSGSRTGWLQMGMLVLLVFWMGPRSGIAPARRTAILLALAFAVLVLTWPDINEFLLLQDGRTVARAFQGDTRGLHWATLTEAISQQPIWGYGWQQVSVAQVRLSDQSPFVGEHIEHSHNIVLDMLIWNGIPIGGILVALAGWWLGSRIWRCRQPSAVWLLVAITGIATHGMLEFPLEYAYFLMPLGLCIGAVDGLQQTARIRIPQWGIRLSGVLLASALAAVAHEYLVAEQANRLLRLESARIGVPGLQTAPPNLPILNQLGAFLKFAHTEARPGMDGAELGWMRATSERFAYPPVMFRYAVAEGLNGRPEKAALTLQRLCKMHPVERCDEGREAWQTLRAKYPELDKVPFPTKIDAR